MATASTSGQSSHGKKKKSPGLMDQLSKFFGGEKKKRSKGSFRGHQATSPQQPSARRRTNENAVVHFFRSLVSSPPPKSTASASRTESTKSPVRRRGNRARCPGSLTWEKQSPVHPQNAGAPSSKLSVDQQSLDPTGPEEPQEQGEMDLQEPDSQPQEVLTD